MVVSDSGWETRVSDSKDFEIGKDFETGDFEIGKDFETDVVGATPIGRRGAGLRID